MADLNQNDNTTLKFLDERGLATLVTNVKNLVNNKTKDSVKYKEFTYTSSDNITQTRKTIQLDNHDTISGITNDGKGCNLVMLSKWDVADYGSNQIHLNLNTSDTVTINDTKVVATIDDVQAAQQAAQAAIEALIDGAPDNLNTLRELAEEIRNLSGSELEKLTELINSKVDSSKLDDYVTKDDISGMMIHEAITDDEINILFRS